MNTGFSGSLSQETLSAAGVMICKSTSRVFPTTGLPLTLTYIIMNVNSPGSIFDKSENERKGKKPVLVLEEKKDNGLCMEGTVLTQTGYSQSNKN
ncbi:MAG: hypothetical protein WCK34_14900 [Bacteroidota bacterium]